MAARAVRLVMRRSVVQIPEAPGSRHRVVRVADVLELEASRRAGTDLIGATIDTLVDTNVWYPVVLADLVARSVEIGLCDLAWTDASVAEVERVLIERKGLTAANAAVFGAQVRATAPRGRIDPAIYLPRMSAMTGRDPGDHVHAAAARAGGVEMLLTANVVDFLAKDVGPACRVLSPGDLIAEMAEHRRRPPMTPHEILDRLEAIGLQVMVNALRQSERDDAD